MPPLQIRKESAQLFEVAGTKEVMQGRQKVKGYYFGSIIPKPKDIRLYYFPIYTHPKEFEWLSDRLRKFLKGKSCFHVKSLDDGMEEEIKEMIDRGVAIYLKENLI